MDEMIPEKQEESEFEAMLKRVIRQRDRLNYDMYERIRRRLLFLRQLELLFKEYVQYQLRGTYTDEPRIGRNAYQLPALIWRAATGRDNRAVPYAVQRRIHKESGTEDILYSKNIADKTPGKSGVQNLRNSGTLPVNTLPDKLPALRILGYDSTYSGEATQRGTLISLTTAHAGGGYRGLPANTEQAKSASARISSAPMKNLDGRASETYTEELRNVIIGRYIDEVSNNNSVPEHLKAHPITTENGNHALPDILIRADRDGITHNYPRHNVRKRTVRKERKLHSRRGREARRVLNSGERYNSSPDKDTADRRTEALLAGGTVCRTSPVPFSPLTRNSAAVTAMPTSQRLNAPAPVPSPNLTAC
ncbi:hypothetical protein CHS0354_018396 [Potamilus streckersoni]|uniref:Uncharacterized protein n=1 Tax=Potamilus streckersoni TaxID=2493646 RepID=A0AAE0TAI5_9BIVA|nr:hypothetical protein CHS0354_018396 [Potamilus streckersoni]